MSPYPQRGEQRYCTHCQQMQPCIKLSPTRIKCTVCKHSMKMRDRDRIDLVTGTFGKHRRGF